LTNIIKLKKEKFENIIKEKFNESRNKKDAELSCSLQLLKFKFPPNWSYG
jgi:hypothetical protein